MSKRSEWPMTWGEIIESIEAILRSDHAVERENVFFDFCGLSPTGEFYCDRGNYSARSIQCGKVANYPSDMNAMQFLLKMKSEVGKTREGYKGGNYTCTAKTEATVTLEHDYSAGTRIFSVEKNYSGILLVTGWWDS